MLMSVRYLTYANFELVNTNRNYFSQSWGAYYARELISLPVSQK